MAPADTDSGRLAQPLLDRVTAETCRPSLLTPPADWINAGVLNAEGQVAS